MTIRLLTDTFTVLDLVACDRCGTTAADYLDLDDQPRFWDLDDAREYLAGWTVDTNLVLCHDCTPHTASVATTQDLTEALVSLAGEDTVLVSLIHKAFTGAESPTRVLDVLNQRGTALPSRLDYHLTTIAQTLRVLAQTEGDAA